MLLIIGIIYNLSGCMNKLFTFMMLVSENIALTALYYLL